MTDLTALPTEELLRLYKQPQSVAGMSNDQLMQMYKQGQPDPVRDTVRGEIAKERAAGIPAPSGFGQQAMQGATFNMADEILAGMGTPVEMISRKTWNPAEAYNYAKARQDLLLDEARKNNGALGIAAEIGGGVLSGSGLARAGVTMMPQAANAGFMARAAGLAGDSAVYGGLSGFGAGSGLGDRVSQAGTGAAVGGAVGGAMGVAAPIVSAAGRNVMGWARATRDPEGYAGSQLARAIMESGQSPQDIGRAVSQAATEGQPYAVADVLGNPGQRLLSSVTRAPGAGRTNAVDFLEARQAGQGRRIANALAEGLDAPQTAAQTRVGLTTARDAAADAAYGAVRGSATPVDLTLTISRIDDTLRPGVNRVVNPGTNIADDSVESALRRVRNTLTDGRSNLTDFNAIYRARGDLADAVEAARRAGAGNKARLLGQVRAELDAALEQASPGYRAANAAFRDASRVIDTVDEGATAALRGRSEDVIPAFRQMTPQQQGAFRSGYADRLIEQAQGGAVGANKARPLTSDAYQAELQAVAPMRSGNQMMTRLGRENRMFETRNHALGGSRTADNLADAEALSSGPEILSNVLSGNLLSAGRNVVSRSLGALSGNTPQVRERLARALLTTGHAPNLQATLDTAVASEETRRRLIAALLRGVVGGGAVSVPATSGTSARR